MSHIPERNEKDCLNCGTIIHGRYCHVCGQENLEPKESFWHLITHVFNDITHFDGKFFTTLKDLLLKPGFLSSEYMRGRRANYLNPVRMYVFTSAIFFLLFFSFFYSDKDSVISISNINGKTLMEIDEMDSTEFAAFTANINKEDNRLAIPMTRQQFREYRDTIKFNKGIHLVSSKYHTKAAYDSALASGAREDNWITRQLTYKEIAINTKYNNDAEQMGKAFKTTLVHSLPQMLFVSLPLMALILKLLYVRRKRFYYVSHGIFSIHLYVFIFIAMLFLFCIGKLNDYLHWSVLGYVFGLTIFSLFVYQYMALKNFYQQGWVKTLFKFILVNFLFSIVIAILFLAFLLLSLFKI